MPGTYTFKPIEAKLTHDTSLLGRMDPYCTFSLDNNTKASTHVCKKGGSHPHWSETIALPAPIVSSNKALVRVMDKDKLLADDNIGSFEMDLKEVQDKGMVSKWYPLSYKGKSAGEILIETIYEPNLLTGQNVSEPTSVFVEQKQVVEPHTFMKEVEQVEIRPETKTIEVMEPVKVVKEVPVTEPVTVTKMVEVTKPEVVTKEIEVMEPRLVAKTIQVVEEVPIKKEVEVVEMKTTLEEVQTVEPQTTMKPVEVTEYVPTEKEVMVTEPVTVKKAVEFVEPVITTKTVTKEVLEPMVVDEKVTQSVGPATMVVTEKMKVEKEVMKEEVMKETVEKKEMELCGEVEVERKEEKIVVEEKAKKVEM